MGRIRIYAGTGKPVYDSEGQPAERTVDRIKREYNRGVALFFDPLEGMVRGQVTLRRHGPEQFVAAYTTDTAEDLIPAFTNAVERTSEERGWPILSGTGGNQAVFDAFASGDAFSVGSYESVREQFEESPISVARLQEELAVDPPVTLQVPDYETAARTLAFVTREFEEDYVVSITESTDVPTIQDSDIMLRPSRRVQTISPGDRLEEHLRREKVEEAVAKVETSVKELRSELRTRNDSSTDMMVDVLTSALYESNLEIFLANSDSRGWRRGALKWFLGVTWAAAVTASVISVLALEQAMGLRSIAGWTVGIVGAGALLWRAVNDGRPEAHTPTDSRLSRDLSSDPGVNRRASRVIESLRAIREVTSQERVRMHLSEILDPYGIEVVNPKALERRRRITVAVGSTLGIAFGLLLFYVARTFLPQL